MNLVEFIFAFSAVFGSTLIHYFWTKFVYKFEKTDSKNINENKVISL